MLIDEIMLLPLEQLFVEESIMEYKDWDVLLLERELLYLESFRVFEFAKLMWLCS